MWVLDLFKAQKIEEGLQPYLAAAQNALFGREDLVAFFEQKNKMTSSFQVATVSVVKPKYEHLRQ